MDPALAAAFRAVFQLALAIRQRNNTLLAQIETVLERLATPNPQIKFVGVSPQLIPALLKESRAWMTGAARS